MLLGNCGDHLHTQCFKHNVSQFRRMIVNRTRWHIRVANELEDRVSSDTTQSWSNSSRKHWRCFATSSRWRNSDSPSFRRRNGQAEEGTSTSNTFRRRQSPSPIRGSSRLSPFLLLSLKFSSSVSLTHALSPKEGNSRPILLMKGLTEVFQIAFSRYSLNQLLKSDTC